MTEGQESQDRREEIPQIQSVGKLDDLWVQRSKVHSLILADSSRRYPDGPRTLVNEDAEKLRPFLDVSKKYLDVSRNLYRFSGSLSEVDAKLQKELDYVVQTIGGKINGSVESSGGSISSLLGIIPIMGTSTSNHSEMDLDVKVNMQEVLRLANTVPSTRGWLKNIIRHYLGRIEGSLKGVKDAEGPDGRIDIDVQLVNDSARDCFNEDSGVFNLMWASDNLQKGVEGLRKKLCWVPRGEQYMTYGEQQISDPEILGERVEGIQRLYDALVDLRDDRDLRVYASSFNQSIPYVGNFKPVKKSKKKS